MRLQMMIKELLLTDIKGLNKLPPADWKFDYERFLKIYLKDDFFHSFAVVVDDKIVGTGNVLIKGEVGWLAHIIVDENYRNRGLGQKITEFLIDFLKSKNCKTQLLIATALGEPIYQKLGFQKLSEYQRFDSEKDLDLVISKSIRPLSGKDFTEVSQIDLEINGEDREHLIKRYFEGGWGFFNASDEMLGFYLPGFGRGLVLAKSTESGTELLKLKHARKDVRTLLPEENRVGIQFLKSLGLKEGPKCVKMYLGEKNDWKPSLIYSYGSGFCG